MAFNLRPEEANLTKRDEECGVKARIPGRGKACAKPLSWVFGVKGISVAGYIEGGALHEMKLDERLGTDRAEPVCEDKETGLYLK